MNYPAPEWQQAPTAPKRRRGRRIALIAVLAVLAVFVLAGIITAATEGNDGINPAASSSTATRAPAPRDDTYAQPPVITSTVTATVTPTAPPAPPKPATPRAYTKDGTYKVGTEIQAGDYTYTVDTSGFGYWALCYDTACSPGAGMIDNDLLVEAGSTGYLTITPDAAYVELQGLTLTPAAP